jgi:hypothetical protein
VTILVQPKDDWGLPDITQRTKWGRRDVRFCKVDIFYLVVLGFEFRAFYLVAKCSIT